MKILQKIVLVIAVVSLPATTDNNSSLDQYDDTVKPNPSPLYTKTKITSNATKYKLTSRPESKNDDCDNSDDEDIDLIEFDSEYKMPAIVTKMVDSYYSSNGEKIKRIRVTQNARNQISIN